MPNPETSYGGGPVDCIKEFYQAPQRDKGIGTVVIRFARHYEAQRSDMASLGMLHEELERDAALFDPPLDVGPEHVHVVKYRGDHTPDPLEQTYALHVESGQARYIPGPYRPLPNLPVSV